MNKYLKYSLFAFAVILVGFSIYYFVEKANNSTTDKQKEEIYTCSMHPEIIRNEPGNCPICGMDLVKKVTVNQTVESHSIDHLLKPTDGFVVGNFKTTRAKDTIIISAINLPGVVVYDPNSSVNIVARISGRIEKMYVHYKFQKVAKGQKLFDLYSPELVTEQQNFIYLISNDAENTSILKALKHKLTLYGMSSSQIKALATTRRVNPVISIYSPATGIVDGTEKMVATTNGSMQNVVTTTSPLGLKEGDYIDKNAVVFKLVNTNRVWGVFNVIQGYSSLIKLGQPIQITSELNADVVNNTKVNFIETQLNPADKTNRIRVYLNNEKLQFPIGLRLNGKAETNAVKGLWLQKQSVVSLGSKKIVYIHRENGFQATEIKAGIEINNYVQVLKGISIEDVLADNAQYLIDSESFIKTKQ